jgi:Tfp pilus assembly protein PilX
VTGRPWPQRARRRPDRDAGAALLLVVMCMLVAMMLSTALLGVITSELHPTSYEAKAARTIDAAEAGLQAGTGVLRAASSTVAGVGQVGDLSKLPCASTSSPITGTVGGVSAGAGAAYSLTIRYFTIDPSGQTAAWRDAHALACTSGLGPSVVPLYALLQSSGTATSTGGLSAALGNRSLEMVYELRNTDQATLGGQIHTGASTGYPDMCWTAPSATPSAGAHLTLSTCVTGAPQQMFAYRTDYSLVLAGTQSASGTGGMCVSQDAPAGVLSYDDLVTSRANNLSGVGGLAAGAAGPLVGGSAAVLNGTTGYYNTVKSEPSPGPQPFTVSTWLKTTAGGMVMQFNDQATGQSSGTYDRSLYMNPTGHIIFGVWLGSAKILTSTAAYTDGNWHHVAASIGSGGEKLYVDGALVKSDATVRSAQSYTGYWHLGWARKSGWPDIPSSEYWNGSLAHVAVWSSQLTDAQVAGLKTATSDADERTTVIGLAPRSYWPLTTPATTLDLTWQACDALNHEKWSYNDSGRFEALKSDGTALSGLCVVGSTPTISGGPLVISSCGMEWRPDAAVGAGAAGAATQQLINYSQYGRCLDVTGQNVNATWMIAYPCKQDPSHPVTWNQRFVWDSAGTHVLRTTTPSGLYCLTDPGTIGGLVVIQVCAAGRTDQVWMMNVDTGNRTTSYTVVSAAGRCLDLGAPRGSGGVTQWSSIVVDVCDGTLEQKWNAPPLTDEGGNHNQRETTRNG